MVEKRKHPLLALFLNQLLYATVAFFIVTSMTGRWQLFFGLFFLMLYLSGLYGYSHRAGRDHQKPYSQVKPSIKYPIAYMLVALGYFAIPLGIAYLAKNWIVQLIVIIWESPFYFSNVILPSGDIHLLPVAIFSGLIVLFTAFGYYAGVKQFYFSPYLNKLLYRPVEKDSEETK